MKNAFDAVSDQYANKALVQQKAAQKLIQLLDIRGQESVLDVACGPGHITKAIQSKSKAKIIGTDISAGMIEQAKKNYPGIEFQQCAAEQLAYENRFDVVFCNSAFQWFKQPEQAVAAVKKALKQGGRIGIACPGTTQWSPWFLKIIPVVAQHPEIKNIFSHWHNPWSFLPTQQDYQNLFEKAGLKTQYISVDFESKKYTIEEAYNIYLSGAANGYVGKDFYDVSITDEYIQKFNALVKAEIIKNSADGQIDVDFNRFYYVGVK